jgi:hypothetical protein
MTTAFSVTLDDLPIAQARVLGHLDLRAGELVAQTHAPAFMQSAARDAPSHGRPKVAAAN